MAFEANQGQTDARVHYVARADGYTLFLTSNEAVMSLASDSVLRIRMTGAKSNPQVRANDVLPGVSNYFIGNDPRNWHTNVHQYARVDYQGVYPGVDLSFHGEARHLEFDFAVAAGADPAPISLSFNGAGVATDASGDLVLSSSAGDVRMGKPVAYQEENGRRHAVNASFVVKDSGQVSFSLGNYDRSRKLVIGPSLSRSIAQDIAMSSSAAAALPPHSSSRTFYLLALPIIGLALAGVWIAPRRHKPLGVLIVCFVFSGLLFLPACSSGKGGGGGGGGCTSNCGGGGGTSTLVYSSYLGGSGDDSGQAIAIDSNGNVYVAGESSSTNFPGSPHFTGGVHDAFVVKVDATGKLAYSTFIGGTALASDDDALGIALTPGGNPVIVGNTQQGTGFPASTIIPPAGGGQDAFVAGFDSNTGSMLFATEIGGTATESGNAIAVDQSSGDIYIVGQTASTDFPVTSGTYPGGSVDAFVVKLNSSGASLVYATFLGGTKFDVATGVAVANGNAYVSGITQSSNLGVPSSSTLIGTEDAFVASFNSSGTEQYFTYVGGSAGSVTTTTAADAITVDSTGIAYITGKTTVSDLPMKQNSLHGTQDAFITKVNTDGSIAFSTYLGGATPGLSGVDADEGLGIAINSGNIFVTGVTTTTDFPVQNPLSGSSTLKGGSDAFVTEFAATGSAPVFSTFFGGSGREDYLLSAGPPLAGAIVVDSNANVYITGSTNSPSNFPLQNAFQGSFTSTIMCGSPKVACPDAFVAKITP
jgi:hypothetical protein